MQRNALQDVALAKAAGGLEAEMARQFNGSQPDDWWTPRPARANRPPEEWTNNEIDRVLAPAGARRRKPDAASWYRVRQTVLRKVREAAR